MNLIDGIDGLSSGLSMFALSGFAALFWQLGVESYTLVSLGLIGAVMAFFFFNVFGSERRGTKTFMGDTGEFGAGLHLGLLGHQIRDEQPHGVGTAPARHDGGDHLLAVPVFDLVRVACMRLLNRKGIFHPDKTHVHHLALAAGFSMTTSLLLILGLQLVIIGVNVVMSQLMVNINLLLLIDVLLYGTFVMWLRWRRDRSPQTATE